MTSNTYTYRSYLVRFWQSNEHGCWRASAQCVQTGDTVVFGEIAQLLTFLETAVRFQGLSTGQDEVSSNISNLDI